MTDRRELILARLAVIAATVADRVGRNEASITGKSATAIVVWDGDEGVDLATQPPRRRADAPILVDMTPEMRILRESPAADIGTNLNELRVALIVAVITDALPAGTLYTIVGPNGRVAYDGAITEMAPGRAMEGVLGVRFRITYPLIFSELQ